MQLLTIYAINNDVAQELAHYATAQAGGCTLTVCHGYYQNKDGGYDYDPTVKVEVITNDRPVIRDLVSKAIALMPNEECVLWTTSPINAHFERNNNG